MNRIFIRRRLKVVVSEGDGDIPLPVIAALQRNIHSLGFILAPEVCQSLQKLTPAKLESFYRGLVDALKEMVGAHREYKPMYPNFPEQVMEASEFELYWNAFIHYCTHRLPEVVVKPRMPLFEELPPKVIGLGTRQEFERIFTSLASAKTSLAGHDRADMAWFVAQYRDDIQRLLPENVPHRENLALLGASLLKLTGVGAAWLDGRVQTATDVLRLAVAMSEGDVSLAKPAKFSKFSRGERRRLLSWVERCENPTEDMLRWKARWVRLGERLHPGEYAGSFPKTAAAFDVLRNDQSFETFNGAVERHLAAGEGSAVVRLLQGRPGELVRRLDHLLRSSANPESVISAFRPLVGKVATPLLLQAMTHFARRDEPQPLRAFFPKGDVAKVQAIPNTLPLLPSDIQTKVSEIFRAALLERFATLPPLGRCFLDPQLVDYLVPFSQRSAAKSLRTLVRGSRLPLPVSSRILRFFIWWRNGTTRTDIDLSAALYDSSFKYVDVVSYYNLKNFGGCHSGDIVDAPQGAAEFIDLDIERTAAQGVRYVVMSINSYTTQPFCDLPECFAGWMSRQDAGSGEIFEPRTVQDKVDIASDTKVCLPAVFDLVERKVIWTDIALRSHPYWNNVANNESGVSLMLRAIVGLKKPSLHTLFDLHIQARGARVDSREDADQVFSVETGLTPFDLDRIAAEYL